MNYVSENLWRESNKILEYWNPGTDLEVV